MQPYPKTLLAFAAVTLAMANVAGAQEARGQGLGSEETPEFGDRTLKGHTFLYPILQEGAFNTSHFGVRQGVAVTNIPQLPLGSVGTFDLSASGLVQNFDLGLRLLSWLGLYGTAEGQVLTGINVPSLLVVGGSFSFRGEGGGIVRIARIETTGTQLSARVFGGAGTGRDLKVLPLVNALLSGSSSLGDVVNGNVGKYILTPKANDTFGGSLHLGQALGRFIGLQAAVEGRSSRETSSPFVAASNANVDQTTAVTSFMGAIGVDIDGQPAGFPLGAMAEYRAQVDNAAPPLGEATSTMSHRVSAGIYYTGRRNLLLGVGGVTQLNMESVTGQDAAGNPAKSGSPSEVYGQFVLRYVW